MKRHLLYYLLTVITVVPTVAWAHVTPFSESYNSESTTEGWTTNMKNRFTPVILNEEGNYFLSVNQNERNNNGCIVTGRILAGKAETGDDFTLTFDMRIGCSGYYASAQWPVSFEIKDASNEGTLFSIESTGINRGGVMPKWQINHSDLMLDLPKSGYTLNNVAQITWCSYKITRKKGLTFLEITNKESGEDILRQTTIERSSVIGGLGDIVFTTKRYYANIALDNIVVRCVEDGDTPDFTPVTYTLRYRNEEGEEIKADSIITSYIGAEVTASAMQRHPIMHNNQKYLYKDGNQIITLTEMSLH